MPPSGTNPRITDDFGSDDIAEPSKHELEPTAAPAVTAGLEETGQDGDTLFHAMVTQVFKLGRGSANNLIVRGDSKISREHAVIEREGMYYILRDNKSSNGTYVNGKRIDTHKLNAGDKISIGKREYTFVVKSR
jgi:predicted component of type VI protein secretion system